MNAPVPSNEAERLRALLDYEILDSAPEVAYERLTQIAARCFSAPIVLISLVDVKRQWFKACFGLDVREMSREISFCAYTILSDDVLIVPDATQDERFRDNPLVTGERQFRFYAGAPLKTPSEQNIGTLCIIDTKPREFSGEQVEMLSDLAALVVDEFNLRQTTQMLRDNESDLKLALRQNSQLRVAVGSLTSGVIITDPGLPDNPIIYANDGFCKLTGYTRGDILGHNCRLLQGPETDRAVIEEMREAIARGEVWNGIVTDHRKDGVPFINEVSINPVFNDSGVIIRWVGLQTDVTERERAKQLLEERVKERTTELANSQIEILNRLARAAEYRDDETGMHTQRVARISTLLAQTLGCSQEFMALISQAAPLHDVGKIAISDLILLKPSALTREEYDTMKTHTTTGAAMLADGRSERVKFAELIALTHHERWDGTGYPRQLTGEQIPLEGRILAVADVFDALTHERPYKAAWPIAEAVDEIAQQSGRHFDPRVVEAFLTLDHEALI